VGCHPSGALTLKAANGVDAGLCWVAARPVAAREVIETGERPVLQWAPPSGAEKDLEEAAEAAARAFLKLDANARNAVLKLSSGPKHAEEHLEAAKVGALRALGSAGVEASPELLADITHAAAVARINGFHGLEDTLCLYQRTSRFNHACAPNAEYGMKDSCVMRVRAIRPISEGEEVCICYLGENVLLSKSVRQRILHDRYFFNCACSMCSAEVDELAARACPTCRSRVSPGSRARCDGCGENLGEQVCVALHEEESFEIQAAMYRAEWESLPQPPVVDFISKHETRVRKMLKKVEDAGLVHHVVRVRLRILLIEILAASLSVDSMNSGDSGRSTRATGPAARAQEAWKLFEGAFAWFQQSWNPLRCCWGVFLADVAAALSSSLKGLPGKRHSGRAERIAELLRGDSLVL